MIDAPAPRPDQLPMGSSRNTWPNIVNNKVLAMQLQQGTCDHCPKSFLRRGPIYLSLPNFSQSHCFHADEALALCSRRLTMSPPVIMAIGSRATCAVSGTDVACVLAAHCHLLHHPVPLPQKQRELHPRFHWGAPPRVDLSPTKENSHAAVGRERARWLTCERMEGWGVKSVELMLAR